MLLYVKWRRSGISRSNLSCLSAGAFAPPVLKEVKKSLLSREFKVWFRCSSGVKGFAEAESPFSRSQDAKHVEG